MKILSIYEDQIKQKLSAAQVETLKILLWLIEVHQEVRIEKLAAYFPLPIKFESRRKHIQRFLKLQSLSIPIFWFPLILLMIENQFKLWEELILVLDRTQWKENNVIMISVVWKKRALPIYWQLLEKKGASNLREQQAVIRPVLKLLKKYQLIIIGDREFHSVELGYWLKGYEKQGLKFAFRQKKTTNIKQKRGYRQLQDLPIIPGVKQFFVAHRVTKKKGFGTFNMLVYQKRKYRKKKAEEPWYIMTNLSSMEKAIKIYQMRMGIEALFKDYKTGGYNLEKSKANPQRLTYLVLLIAISYTLSSIKGQKIKNDGYQQYIARLTEKGRTTRRHSCFWIGLYGQQWIVPYRFLEEWTMNLMSINSHKLPFYQKGIKVMSYLESLVGC